MSEAATHDHWYCEPCGEEVKLPLDLESPARCPLCRQRTAVRSEVRDLPRVERLPRFVTMREGKVWFDEMRACVAAAPEWKPA